MKIKLFNCKFCEGTVRTVKGQSVTSCSHCNSKYYLKQETPPAVVLKPELNRKEAKQIILKGYMDKKISKNFLKSSSFKRAVLYYIPFFEIREIKTSWHTQPRSKLDIFVCQAYDSLERASDLNELALELFDSSIIENSILKAQQIPFNPVKMRKEGVVIPFKEIHLLKKNVPQIPYNVIENYCRLIYFPVWEISYSYQGFIFKSYLSAIDGKIIKIRALKNHGKKILMSMLGLLSLALLLGLGFRESVITAILAVIFGIPMLYILLPFFWEMFAFGEIIEIGGETIEAFPINYTENSFVKLTKKTTSIFRKETKK